MRIDLSKYLMDKWLRSFGIVLLVVLAIVPAMACNTYETRVTYITSTGLEPVGDREDALEMLRDMALVTVMVQSDGGTGSGVVFDQGRLVLTAAHVVSIRTPLFDENGEFKGWGPAEIGKAAVLKNTGAPTPFVTGVEVIKFDEDLDLAILKLAQVYPYGSATFASNEPVVYQKCWISGHPLGVTDTMITEGRVQALWDHDFVRYSSLSTFGNSGGPVWIRESNHYKVWSICQRVNTGRAGDAITHMGLGVLQARMRAFLEEYLR